MDKKIKQINKKNRIKYFIRNTFLSLAIVVSLLTFYSLIIPTLTINRSDIDEVINEVDIDKIEEENDVLNNEEENDVLNNEALENGEKILPKLSEEKARQENEGEEILIEKNITDKSIDSEKEKPLIADLENSKENNVNETTNSTTEESEENIKHKSNEIPENTEELKQKKEETTEVNSKKDNIEEIFEYTSGNFSIFSKTKDLKFDIEESCSEDKSVFKYTISANKKIDEVLKIKTKFSKLADFEIYSNEKLIDFKREEDDIIFSSQLGTISFIKKQKETEEKLIIDENVVLDNSLEESPSNLKFVFLYNHEDDKYSSLSYTKIEKDKTYKLYNIKDNKISSPIAFDTTEDLELHFKLTEKTQIALFEETTLPLSFEKGSQISIQDFENLVQTSYINAQDKTNIVVELSNTVLIDTDYSLDNSLVNYANLTVKRAENFKKELFCSTSNLNVGNITIDGNSEKSFSPLLVNKGNLNLLEGSVFKNNDNQGPLKLKNDNYPYRAEGGAIWSNGSINISNTLIENCLAQVGGAIFIESDSTVNFSISDGTIQNNKAKYYTDIITEGIKVSGQYESWSYYSTPFNEYRCSGGGIYIGDNVEASMSGGSIINNSSARVGGGISIRDISRATSGNPDSYVTNFSMYDGDISSNTAGMSGGGICVGPSGKVLITGGEISYNIANSIDPLNDIMSYSGGGIYVDSAGWNGSEISGNGLPAKLEIYNVAIYENKAFQYGGGYAGCALSKLQLYNEENVLFYDNHESSVYKDKHDIDIHHLRSEDTTISNYMLGGAPFNWDVYTNPSIDRYKAGSLNTSSAKKKSVQSLVNVRIHDNSADIGGGIGNNGNIIMGRKTNSQIGLLNGQSDKQTISVKKVWDDNNSSERPQEITVNLLKDNQIVDTVILNNSNNWNYIWTALDYGDYSIQENSVEGYLSEITEKEGITTKVKQLQNDGKFMFLFGGASLESLGDTINYKNLKWNFSGATEADYWIANGSQQTDFTLTNSGTGYKLGYFISGVYGKTIFALSKKFNYQYSSDLNSGVLYAKYWSSKRYIKANYNYNYLPTIKEGQASNIDLYQYIDKEFTITNTKNDGNKINLTLEKVSSDNGEKLSAKFTLFEESDLDQAVNILFNNTTQNEYKGIKIGDYSVRKDNTTVLENLKTGVTYFLIETEAPNGYNQLIKPIVIRFEENGELSDITNYPEELFILSSKSNLSYSTFIEDDSKLKIKNDLIYYNLPETGGIGVEFIYIIGIIITTITGLSIYRRRV